MKGRSRPMEKEPRGQQGDGTQKVHQLKKERKGNSEEEGGEGRGEGRRQEGKEEKGGKRKKREEEGKGEERGRGEEEEKRERRERKRKPEFMENSTNRPPLTIWKII